jgi:hypothetical protein
VNAAAIPRAVRQGDGHCPDDIGGAGRAVVGDAGRIARIVAVPDTEIDVDRDPPFDRKPGDKPALTEAEMGDIITFLGTLNDGYRP